MAVATVQMVEVPVQVQRHVHVTTDGLDQTVKQVCKSFVTIRTFKKFSRGHLGGIETVLYGASLLARVDVYFKMFSQLVTLPYSSNHHAFHEIMLSIFSINHNTFLFHQM